jgi:acyl dehydratase
VSAPGVRRYYEDLVVGAVSESQPRRVTLEEMLEFARRYDPQYFHTDEQAAKQSTFGEVVASGLHTLVLWRELDHAMAPDIAWICGVAWDEVRWPVAVRSDDVLRARAECLSKRPSATDPKRGVVVLCYTLLNHRDQVVFTCRSTNLIEMQSARA